MFRWSFLQSNFFCKLEASLFTTNTYVWECLFLYGHFIIVSVCLSVCVHHNLSTNSLIVLACGILLKDPSGKKPIKNGHGLVKIVEMGGILVFFLYVLSVVNLNLLFWVGEYDPNCT